MTNEMKEIPTVPVERLKKPHWTQNEIENARLVAGFVQNLMNNHDFDYVLNTYQNHTYKQHNRSIRDGVSGLVEYVNRVVNHYPSYSYDVRKIHVDGEQVIFHSHVTLREKDRGDESKGFIIIDTWKVIDLKIVEHWDAIQPLDVLMRLNVLLSGGKIENHNGLF